MSEDWFESEESTRIGLISELQRIVRRTRARPFRVIALAILLVGAVAFKIIRKKDSYQAEVVLSLTEESLSTHKTNIPVEELKDYVWTVLMSDSKLAEIVERRDLHKLRKTFGMAYGIEQLRGQVDIAIWKNSFVDFKNDEANGLSSARIGITVTDGNPTQAFDIARDIAEVVVKTAEKQEQDIANKVAGEVRTERDDLVKRLSGLATEVAALEIELEKSRVVHDAAKEQVVELQIASLNKQQKSANNQLVTLSSSRGAIADRITAAGLDMTIEVIDEHRPEPAVHSSFILILILTVVGVCSLVGSMLVVGAFDSRVHDTDDVLRLGLPMLGHVPGFPGDDVASLRARGAGRPRVPSFLRWRSHR